jgi:hypothetical protein
VGASEIELAVLPGLSSRTRAQLVPWARAALEATASLSGALRPRVQLVVLPVPEGRSQPVPFGMMTRGGGASAGLLVSADAEPEALLRDWVLVHELSHLFLPFVARSDAWLSEGLATYYQEVLRVRAGLLEQEQAWRRLLEGAGKARTLARSLTRESEEVFSTHAFAPVYWGGATFWLWVDVELRRRSGGRVSLDSVVAALARCCTQSVEPWSAERIVALIDQETGDSVASEALSQIARTPRFPDLTELFVRLGVRPGDKQPSAEAWIADAIMTRAVGARAVSALQAPDGGGTRRP